MCVCRCRCVVFWISASYRNEKKKKIGEPEKKHEEYKWKYTISRLFYSIHPSMHPHTHTFVRYPLYFFFIVIWLSFFLLWPIVCMFSGFTTTTKATFVWIYLPIGLPYIWMIKDQLVFILYSVFVFFLPSLGSGNLEQPIEDIRWMYVGWMDEQTKKNQLEQKWNET